MKKLLENIANSWRSTVLGFGIVAATIYSILKFPEHFTWWPQGSVGILIGVLLVLSPDTLVKGAMEIIRKVAGIENKDTQNKQQ